MIFRSRAAQTTILAAGSALALITATAGDCAHAEGNLEASYTISFARNYQASLRLRLLLARCPI
jgi:hypothetical protein